MKSKFEGLDLTGSRSEGLKSNIIRQVIDFLDENYDIRINRFKQSEKEIISKTKDYTFPPSLDDISLHLIENEIAVPDSILRKIINSPNQIQTYNPIAEYFDDLTFNGSSHIDKLCGFLKPVVYGDHKKTYYTERTVKLIKKWLVAAVACGLGDHQNEVALGFIQEEEGTGKTTICNLLCPRPLRMMFIKSDKEKNGFNLRQAFTENFLVLFDEFIGLTRFTAENFKSTMSAFEIDVKERHDPFPRRKPRIGNALFTSNNKTGSEKGFLIPGLGTRRFACVHIEDIDYDSIVKEVDFDQIWAEAVTLYHGGFDFKYGPADFSEFKEYNVRFMIETNALKLIEANFVKPINGSDGEYMMPIDILQYFKDKRVVSSNMLNELSPEKIGAALKQLGYQKRNKRVAGIPRHPYHLKRI